MNGSRSRVGYFVAAGAMLLIAIAVYRYFTRVSPIPLEAPEPTQVALEKGALDVADAKVDPFALRPWAPTPPRTTTSTLAPAVSALPDVDLPLVDQLDALLESASVGEPVASCRLAIADTLCGDLELAQDFANTVESSLARETAGTSEDLMVDLLAGSAESANFGNQLCRGVKAERIPDTGTLLERAVSKMTVRQKVVLAMLSSDGRIVRLPRPMSQGTISGGDTRYVYPQFLADHFQEFLSSGLQTGDPLALEGAILLHAPSRLPGEGQDVRPHLPDAYRFAGYSLLYSRLFGPESLGPIIQSTLEQALASIPPDKRSELMKQVDWEARRWNSFASVGAWSPSESQAKNPLSYCEN